MENSRSALKRGQKISPHRATGAEVASLSLSKAFYGLAVKRGKIIKILGKGVSRPRSGLRKPGLVATSEVKEIRDQPL